MSKKRRIILIIAFMAVTITAFFHIQDIIKLRQEYGGSLSRERGFKFRELFGSGAFARETRRINLKYGGIQLAILIISGTAYYLAKGKERSEETYNFETAKANEEKNKAAVFINVEKDKVMLVNANKSKAETNNNYVQNSEGDNSDDAHEDPETRLARLERLKQNGLISESEYLRFRNNILNESKEG